jgi:hypothetical protein
MRESQTKPATLSRPEAGEELRRCAGDGHRLSVESRLEHVFDGNGLIASDVINDDRPASGIELKLGLRPVGIDL